MEKGYKIFTYRPGRCIYGFFKTREDAIKHFKESYKISEPTKVHMHSVPQEMPFEGIGKIRITDKGKEKFELVNAVFKVREIIEI